MKLYGIGIDINVNKMRGVLLRRDGVALKEVCVEPEITDGGKGLCGDIILLIHELLKGVGGFKTGVSGIVIACSGEVDGGTGTVISELSLGLRYYRLADEVSEKAGMPVRLISRADASVLGAAVDCFKNN